MSFRCFRLFGLVCWFPRVRVFSLLRVVVRALLGFVVAVLGALLRVGFASSWRLVWSGRPLLRVLFLSSSPWLASSVPWGLRSSVRAVAVFPAVVSRRSGAVLLFWLVPLSVRPPR